MRMSVGLLVLVAWVGSAAAREAAPVDGRALYVGRCADCHGLAGRGDGPDAAAFTPRPRDLRAGLLEKYDDAALVRTVRDGAALPLALDPDALRARATEVESIVTHLQRLPDVDWNLVERGEDVFVARCELCHGPFGQPGSAQPPGVSPPRDLATASFQHSVTDRQLLTVVRHGRRGMPAIPALRSDDDGRALVAFVRVLSPGFQLYARYCSACHGEDGRADELVDPGHAPPVAFDRAYVRGADPEVLRTKVWHMLAQQRPAMPHFRRRLDERQVRAIVAYLKGLH